MAGGKASNVYTLDYNEEIQSDVDATEPSLPISQSKSQNRTTQELLAIGRDRRPDATTFQCEAEIMSIRTKKSWYYPACGNEKCKKGVTCKDGQICGKCKKGVTCKDGQLWCYTCNKHVSYRRSRFKFQVDVMDATAQIVIVMWDETALELTKSSAKALLDES
ncbi:nucleic acid-binding, OB-fold protein [Artemisia annua]|uniref:Nucleic acid-binding, OB-fold protein n=1 Tax=Artemisia annua TaxID=35608 RepID=A0A2U1MG52_ARTAN|nr:nucleic acid-binding, OB-fold protein [Artemisia annua]